jgi:hypothetical protein
MMICYKCDYCGKIIEYDNGYNENLNDWIFIIRESEDKTKYYGCDAIIPDVEEESNLQFLMDKMFCSLTCLVKFLVKHLEGEK